MGGEDPFGDSLLLGEEASVFSSKRRDILEEGSLLIGRGADGWVFFENLIIVCIPTCARSAQKNFWGVFERKK